MCVKIVKILENNNILLVSDIFRVADMSKMRRFVSLAT